MQAYFDVEDISRPIPEILAAGQMQVHKASKPMSMESHEHAFELLYLTSGLKTIFCDGQAYHMRGGDMLLMHPNEQHGNPEELQSRSTMRYIIFRDPISMSEFLNMRKPERVVLDRHLRSCRLVRPSAALVSAFDNCFNAAWGVDPLMGARLRATLFLLLDTLVKTHTFPMGTADIPDDVARALRLIHHQGDKRLSVEAMAQAANLSVPHFKQKFKHAIGIPPADYLLRLQINKACKELTSSDHSVTWIAMQLGFSSSQHFASIFKRHTGVTPSAFRKLG